MLERSPQLTLAEMVDAQCDRYEEAFRAGQNPRIESFLVNVDATVRPSLFRALLELDVELRQREGETPLVSDYDNRFPEDRSTIQSIFEDASRAASLVSSVKLTGVETSQGPRVHAASPKPMATVPTRLGRFEIRSVLGEGAFGTVYRARDPQLDRDVALKVPRFAGKQSLEERTRFLREARAAAALHHAHICPVHEVGTTDDRDYIVLAFIDGKPLSKLLQTRPKLSGRQVAAVIRKLALALQEAHDQGIIHRDLKPANIMINLKGEPVIMDFGLARRDKSDDARISHSGQIMGTPAYMSPEQARGDGKGVGTATDVYSLGVILYELLCGRRPFEGTVTEVIGQILHIDPPEPSQFRADIDPGLQAICMRAIAKTPAARFSSMQEFATALADYVRTTPRAVQPTAPAVESVKEFPTNQFADLLAAISFDVESKIERAVTNVALPHRIPWWTYLIGSAVMGLIVLMGIFFFIRKDAVTVIVNIPIENITDPSLSFVLDDKPIAAKAFAAPIELKPGKHELVVNQNGALYKRFAFDVGAKQTNPVVVQDVSPAPIEEPTFPVDDGFVSLFNGKDLSGWLVESGDADKWKVQMGEITVDAPAVKDRGWSWLLTEKSYSDFIARWEFRCGDFANSGFAIRALPGERPQAWTEHNSPSSIPIHLEITILNQGRDPKVIAQTGALIASANDSYVFKPTDISKQKSNGEWNDMEVELRGQQIKVRLNGSLILDRNIDDLAKKGSKHPGIHRTSGRIGFQRHTGHFQFRNIRIRELERDPVVKVDEPDRKAAEYLLSLGGGFVKVNEQDRQIRQVSGLPTGPFRLTGAYFAEVKTLDDDGLAVLKDCVHLTELDLRSTRVTEKGLEIFRGKTNFTSLGLAYLRVTDTGLEIFKGNKELKALFLHDTFLTDKGLSLFHDCKELGTIWVGGTPITDAGMLPFRECKFLKWLDVRATKVTRDGVQTMKAALPACRVDADPDKR